MGLTMQRGLGIFDQCDVVIIPTTCDAKRKLGEELSAFREVWMLETPHVKDSAASRRLWLEQMYALKSKLEAYVGNGRRKNGITSRKLSASIEASARSQMEVRRFLEIRKHAFPAIWGRQAATVMNAYAYAPRTEWTRAMSRLNEELEAAMKQNRPVCSPQAPRILLAGSPAIFPNLKIPSLVEEMGGVVVFDESCAGDRYLYDPVGSTEKNLSDQMSAIGARYLSPCVCPAFAPNSDRLTFLECMADDHRVDGVLYQVLKGCIIYDFELFRVEKSMREKNIPLLRVETDYNPEDVEQLRTRIEAFIEMLHAKKKK
jgi:benzoyl-CoA reductase/2-hydroxyglutaryl-CoA dehydratase subunit BcrC/BadD/HgdB